MIVTFLITIIIESTFVIAYSLWRHKPVKLILFTSLCGNLLTQSLLWIVLNILFQNYLVILLITEILIWILESILLYFIRPNHLTLKEATLLSLGMNATSFVLGWSLPI